MIRYYELCGGDKQLNQIVMAGAHDAGITGGSENVQTQDINVGDQARAGVRFFDLRVKSLLGDARTYHGKMINPDLKSKLGAYGEGLSRILRECRAFVETGKGASEFLILKFDKCTGWKDIARECIGTLGDFIYKGHGSLNTRTLEELKGKVVVVFTEKGAQKAAPYSSADGIFKVKALTAGGHDPHYDGLQYVGKGGTKWNKAGDESSLIKDNKFDKIIENIVTQQALMQRGRSMGDPDLVGMMYWTTTGFMQSIRKRNDLMWQQAGRSELKKLWMDGIEDAITERAGKINAQDYASGSALRQFMPNIVMIDFANKDKCKVIAELNTLANTSMTEFFRRHGDAGKRAALIG